MRMFLRRPTVGQEPLPLSMSGVRAGERVLQLGVDDPRLAGQIAAKVGLNGHAAVAVTTEADAARVRAAAADAGVLVDVQVAALDAFSFPGQAFDVVVVHSTGGLVASLEVAARIAALRRCFGALRSGGRVIVVEAGPREGLAALFRSRAATGGSDEYAAAGGAASALQSAGFAPVRVLAEREGYRFTEGLRPAH